jgi:cytochrome c553
VTGVTRPTNGLSVITWDGTPGSAGFFQLFQKRSLSDAGWQAVGAATALHQATVSATSSSGFFRVSGPAPVYGGVGACVACHGSTVNTVNNTPHARAFQPLQATNDAYLYSHTVGYKSPTGFRSAAATPGLENVQCENCHGPAANHAANYIDPTVRARVDVAATVCGGCHTGPQQPIYNEWATSEHSEVVEDMNPSNRINTCGRCHSGSVRLSLLNAEPLPAGDANVPVVCAVCHDPHAVHTYANVLNGVYTFVNPISGYGIVISNTQLGAVYTDQLLNPYASTNNYSVTDATFASQYNPNINLCAQCHNDRGASWTNWSYPPHNSLQYNMLLGTVGVLASGAPPNLPGTHSQLEKQCVSCHMQTAPYQSAAQPAITGHSFKVQLFNVCTPCHDGQGQGLVEFMNMIVSNRVTQVIGNLDAWATNTATSTVPPALTNYGTLAWEYANPGGLSSGGPGPTNAALQAMIPVNIQKARFNLYSVYNDGSGGVHNPFYALTLLDTAAAWVQGELNKTK